MNYDKIAYYYDLLHADLEEDIPFMLQEAAVTGGPILELGCGSGRLLRPLARAGHNITGVDNSRAMLALAREHLLTEENAAVRERITIAETDMFELDLPLHSFRLAIIPYNTFLHVREAQIRPLLRLLHKLLKPPGRLIIDLVNPALIVNMPEVTEETLETTIIDPQTGHEIQQWYRNRLEVDKQIYHIAWTFKEVAGEQLLNETKVTIPYHYYYPHQLQMHLSNANFKLEHFYGAYDHTPFNELSERLIVTAVGEGM